MANRRRRRRPLDNMQIAGIVLGVSVVILIVIIVIALGLRKNKGTTPSQQGSTTTVASSENNSSKEETSSAKVETETKSEADTTSSVQTPETTTEGSGEVIVPETTEGSGESQWSGEGTASAETTAATNAPETTAAPTQAPTATPAPPSDGSNPMSKYAVHEGQWDLATLDNTERGFGYSEANRAENMVPTDWAYYENKWGMYNVDWIQDISSNTIYLTMDVGFANPYTEGIIDTLKAKNVKVVFFITKMFFDSSPDTVQRMLDEGHIIGNHSCTHRSMPSIGVDAEISEIMDLSNAMYDKFGYEMKLFRFPEGRFSDQSLALVENLGLKAVFWSYAYNDYSTVQPEVQPSYEKAVKFLHPGAVYLLHASSSTNAAFLGDWIDAARAAGFEFGTYPLNAN